MSSKRTFSRRSLLKGAAVSGGALWLNKAGFAIDATGPSTTVRPYVLPSIPGVQVTPILTTGDAVNGYRLVGIPDGLGALPKGKNFELFVNHEIPTGSPGPGIVRAHGSNGAFVSKWTIDRTTLKVLHGEDLTQKADQIHLWDAATKTYHTGTTQWRRLCSADLPLPSALQYGSLGTGERIFFDGEEVTDAGNWGRTWARIVTGPNAGHAWELPRLGRLAFENSVACPHGKGKTIVALFDDGSVNTTPPTTPLPDNSTSNPSEVYIYIGTKQSHGNEIEKAGLTNGKFYGLLIFRGNALVTAEDDKYGFGNAKTGFVGSARFELVEVGADGDVSGYSGSQIETDSISKNIFRFQRPEDGAWDPRGDSNDALYFVTTGGINADTSVAQNSRLWRIKFKDLDHPLKGGKIEILRSGVELGGPGWRMFDNICIDNHGRLLLQEDTGNNPWVSRIWLYSIDNDELFEIAHHDPQLFDPTVKSPDFITQDEESSGIIDAEAVLGKGWFLFDVQNHKVSADPELCEGGQLLALYVNPKIGASKTHGKDDHDDKDRKDDHGKDKDDSHRKGHD